MKARTVVGRGEKSLRRALSDPRSELYVYGGLKKKKKCELDSKKKNVTRILRIYPVLYMPYQGKSTLKIPLNSQLSAEVGGDSRRVTSAKHKARTIRLVQH